MGEKEKGGLLEERGLNGLGGVEGGRRGVIDFSPPRREKREEKGEIRRLGKEVVGEGGGEKKGGKKISPGDFSSPLRPFRLDPLLPPIGLNSCNCEMNFSPSAPFPFFGR